MPGVFPNEGPGQTHTFDEQTTTSSYEVLDEEKNVRNVKTKELVLVHQNANSNSIYYKVLGSVDGGENYDKELVSETSITAGSTVEKSLTTYVTHIKVMVKDNAGSDDVKGRMASILA